MTYHEISVAIQASTINESITGRSFLKITKDQTVLEYLIRRLKEQGIHKIILAVSDMPQDDALEEEGLRNGVKVYRGSREDIPDRLWHAAQILNAGDIVRVNASYPFVDIGYLKELYAAHVDGGYDYSYNEHLHGVIYGMGCDVFHTDFLRQLNDTDMAMSQRSVVGIHVRQNRNRYHVHEHQYAAHRPGYKLSLESRKDFDVIREVAGNVPQISCESVSGYLGAHPLTAKYNLEPSPKETGVEKLFLNPGKTDRLLRRGIPDDTYPISVELTLTNACNMNCVYCSDAMLRARQGMKEKIAPEDFRRLFLDLAKGGTKGIVMEGGGEPTLYSGFDDVVDMAVASGMAVGLITNGSARLSEDVLKKFEWIRVSLDASTSEEYRQLKGVDFYEKVLDNIAHYAKHCPATGVGYVVTNRNISQIESLVMRLKEQKVSYIQLRPVVDNEDLYPAGIDLSYLKFYMTKDFGVHVDGMVENAAGGNHGLPCYASSITSVISGDGDVYICGRLNVYDWLKPIGNICRQSFHDIWNGEERKKQISMISDAEFCRKNCPQCRVSKFNVLVDKLHAVKSVHFI